MVFKEVFTNIKSKLNLVYKYAEIRQSYSNRWRRVVRGNRTCPFRPGKLALH